MKILLVSNMFPDKKHPSYGIFVKKFCDELDILNVSYDKSVMLKKDSKIGKIAGYLKFYSVTFFKTLFGRYDAVYIHYASHSSAPVLAACHFRKKTIFTNVHGSDVVPENARHEKLQKYTVAILKKSSKIIVPSQYFERYVRKKYKLKNTDFYIYPSGGVDNRIFHEMSFSKKSEMQSKYNLDPMIPSFGMAGRISAGKGWDTFLKAAAAVQKQGIKANFLMVGDGPEREEFLSVARELGIIHLVKQLGLLPQNELAEFYNAIDYFVFPTKRAGESLGLVAIEAMACGTPVISSDYAAPKYYIEDGVNGYKFAVDDWQELCTCMKRCCHEYGTPVYDSLREGALQTAEEYYSDHVREKLKDVFE